MKLLSESQRMVVVLLTIILKIISVKGNTTCQLGSKVTSIRYSDTIVNHTIVGPLMSNITAKNERECVMECHLAVPDKCYMFNYHPSSKVCELLYDDRAAEYKVMKKNGSSFKTRKCVSNPCLPGYACFNLGDQSNDTCLFVKDIDECASNPCKNGGTCQDQDFSYNCTCAAGFTGIYCEKGGVWTPWTSWSACYLPDCPRTRTRNCTNPAAPQNIGTNCSGPAVDNTTCQIPAVDISGCKNPLGMEDGRILDAQITASSQYDSRKAPKEARLNNKPVSGVHFGSWVPAAGIGVGEYVQVDLGRVKNVTQIATQGMPIYNERVTEYSVSYSNTTSNWTDYYGDCVKKFPGNFDSDTVVTNNFQIPIIAQHIRVIVQKWNQWPSMRMELYGCETN